MWVQVPPSVPFIMKSKTKKDIKEALIGGAIVLFFIWVLCGCTTPNNYEHFNGTIYQYYVIGEHSDEPDAYFKTKDEAEDYKEYFKEHHNYKIVFSK